MNFKKLYAFTLAAGLVLQTTVAVRAGNEDGVLTPESKQNAVKFLAAAAREAQQLSAPANRVRAQALAADLLWEHDERKARALFENAIGELQSLLAAINPPDESEMTRTERANHYAKRDILAVLRRELLLSLAAHDPKAALAALAALKVKTLGEYDPLLTDELELRLTTVVARKDPEKAQAVAQQQLDANGLNYQFVQTLRVIHKRDSQVAATVAKDVLAKIRTSKIHVPLETDKSAITNNKQEIDFYQLSHFINTASELNRAATRDKEKKMQPLLAAAEMKELVELAANAYLAARNPVPHSISQVMPEIAQLSPALAQRIRVKIGAAKAVELDKYIETHMFYIARNEKSIDEVVKDAERSPADVRDQRLAETAYKAIEDGDAEKAQTIAARIKERKNFEYLFEQIKEAMPLSKARRGDLVEVRKILAGRGSGQEKIMVLAELAAAVAAKGDKDTAKQLLDEAFSMMPADFKNYSEVESAVRIAAVYATVAPEQAFTIIENGIGRSDEYINAGVKVDEFYVSRSSEANELLFGSINRQFLMNVPNATELIKNLARADFERTIALADRFQRPEIRLFIRLRVLEALLDSNAAEKEKNARDQLAGDEEI